MTFIFKDEDNNVLNITTSDLNATAISGMSFYDFGSGSVSLDNMSVYIYGTDATEAKLPTLTTITAPVGADITVAGVSVTADETGVAKALLVPGVYAIEAVCDGYESYSGTITVDDAYTVSITMTQREDAITSVTVNYLDENGNTLKDSVEITQTSDGGALYATDSYELTDDIHFAPYKELTEGEIYVYDVYAYDESLSTISIDSLLETGNELNVILKKLDGVYFDYEDFSSLTGKWGFTEGYASNVSISDGVLNLLVQNRAGATDIKEFGRELTRAQKTTVKFDYKSTAGSGRTSRFDIEDTNGNVIFSIWNYGAKNSVGGYYYAVNQEATTSSSRVATNTGGWITVELTMDFDSKQ